MRSFGKAGGIFVFIGFFLLGGVCQLFSGEENLFSNTLMFCANFMIYAGLLLYWMRSVRERLLPTRTRAYVLSAAVLMLSYLTLRVFKYRVAGSSPLLSRYAAYAYWIPQVLVPTLFLLACLAICRGERGTGLPIPLLPAFALVLLVMTNDIHFLVYIPKIGLAGFAVETGTYSLGFGFYLLYAWMIGTAVTGFVLLFRVTRKIPLWVTLAVSGVLALWVTLLLLRILIFDSMNRKGMYQVPEIHTFAMLAIFEICIRARLIPHNENYAGYFSRLDIPMAVTDLDFRPVYVTSVPIIASARELSASLRQPLHVAEDTLLFGMPIRGGYAFWVEDETELRKERHRLASANELLSEENDLIAVENQLREQKAHLDAQKRVYDRIGRALYPKQQKIEALLANADPRTPGFAHALGRCCVLNAYSKRKSNLLLLSEDTLQKRNRELFLALQETARFLTCCGVEAAAVGEEYSCLPLAEVHRLYDAFEEVVEAFLPSLRSMTVSLMQNGIRLAMETGAAREEDWPEQGQGMMGLRTGHLPAGAGSGTPTGHLPAGAGSGTPLREGIVIAYLESDELTFVTIKTAKGGER